MRNHSFSYQELSQFSNSLPYLGGKLSESQSRLLQELEKSCERLNFPAISPDIGSFLGFLWKLTAPKKIFEMGSGYGHSAFWHLLGAEASLTNLVLTEKRSDLKQVYESFDWPKNWKEKMHYYQGDAFDYPFKEGELFDAFLIDGVKADYLNFVHKSLEKLKVGGLIVIDNSYWRGSFLDPNIRQTKKSAKKIFDLHEWIASEKRVQAVFIPYPDGLTLLRKLF